MKRRWLTLAMVAVLGTAGLAGYSNAADPVDSRQFVGTWDGSWEGGGGGGKFNIKYERNSDGTLKGGVDVSTDGGDYKASFVDLSFTGGKMTARYEYPLDAQGEIILDGSFDAAKASGTWKLVQKGGTDAFISGTWTVKKN
jgi:hypothetical protein